MHTSFHASSQQQDMQAEQLASHVITFFFSLSVSYWGSRYARQEYFNNQHATPVAGEQVDMSVCIQVLSYK